MRQSHLSSASSESLTDLKPKVVGACARFRAYFADEHAPVFWIITVREAIDPTDDSSLPSLHLHL
jgi:hypothetical protein